MVYHSIFSLKVDHGDDSVNARFDEDQLIVSMEDLIDSGYHSRNNVILRSCTCILSCIASIALIWMVRRSNAGLSTTYHRLQLGLSITDILFSLFLGCFNIMAPKENSYFSWNAQGNMASCDAQGFITYFAFTASGFYSISLNLYYLAVVKYEKSDEYIRKKLEPFLHGIPTITALVMSVTLLAFSSFNDDGDICWNPTNNPLHCDGIEDGQVRDGFEIPCGRGRGGFFIYNIFFQIKVFSAPVIAGISIILLYRAVVQVENKRSKYGASSFRATITAKSNQSHTSSNAEDIEGGGTWNGVKRFFSSRFSFIERWRIGVRAKSQTRSHSRTVMYKALAYTLGYSLTWIFMLFYFFMGDVFKKPVPIEVVYLANVFIPIQGVYNFIIYFVPRILSVKNKSKRVPLSWRQATVKAFWSKGGKTGRGGTGSRVTFASRSSIPNANTTTDKRGSSMTLRKKQKEETTVASHTSRLREDPNRTTADRKLAYTANNTDNLEDCPRGELNKEEILKKEVNDSRLDESLEKIAEVARLPLVEKDIENGLYIAKENEIPKKEFPLMTTRSVEDTDLGGQVIKMSSHQNANTPDSIRSENSNDGPVAKHNEEALGVSVGIEENISVVQESEALQINVPVMSSRSVEDTSIENTSLREQMIELSSDQNDNTLQSDGNNDNPTAKGGDENL